QQQLVESEKMASLGGLVAGIAHEVNTPLGIGVTAASYLKDQTDQLLDQYQQKTMKRSALEQYLKGAAESTSIVLDNLMRASGLVKSFKQVAVDQSSDERRSFHLQPYLNDILRSLHPKLKKLPHQVLIEGSEEIEVMNDPGAFSQVITNLVMNSVIHGLDDEVAGTITMTIDEDDERVTLLYQDDGRGASAEVVEKIFEPFFTTRRGEGGSGLGMHLVYNLITQKMKGGIECQSKPGEGMSFQISLPK
ncbi:MAG: HAMP domain-containing histidine kinase, partial [Gammaproteobacteria bacterium]|nr:HAMP domain-containing histidine kinase [Gammaproteobacteria bacterium]